MALGFSVGAAPAANRSVVRARCPFRQLGSPLARLLRVVGAFGVDAGCASRELLRYYGYGMKARSHLLRRGRFSESGRIYLVTTVTRERARVFDDFRIARVTILQLRKVSSDSRCSTLAFVLMPDHLHWLVQIHEATLSQLVAEVKANSAREVNRLLGGSGQSLWQKGFHDHAVRREESLREIGRYVVMNPVRAGLARRPGEYSHWDAAWL